MAIDPEVISEERMRRIAVERARLLVGEEGTVCIACNCEVAEGEVVAWLGEDCEVAICYDCTKFVCELQSRCLHEHRERIHPVVMTARDFQPDNDPQLRAETDAYNRDIARREAAQREADRRVADRIDGYDRDDLGESPDF